MGQHTRQLLWGGEFRGVSAAGGGQWLLLPRQPLPPHVQSHHRAPRGPTREHGQGAGARACHTGLLVTVGEPSVCRTSSPSPRPCEYWPGAPTTGWPCRGVREPETTRAGLGSLTAPPRAPGPPEVPGPGGRVRLRGLLSTRLQRPGLDASLSPKGHLTRVTDTALQGHSFGGCGATVTLPGPEGPHGRGQNVPPTHEERDPPQTSRVSPWLPSPSRHPVGDVANWSRSL